jgi:glycosyltransferase involved in cell wall biosynthesis
MRIAIVHEWLTVYAGSERVLEQMLCCFPNADLFCLVDFLPVGQRQFIQDKTVNVSFIQKFPLARKYYRQYLSLMPLAIEQFDLSKYDLIISSNHAVAKGVLTGPDQLHLCMCYSPIRYAWDLQHQYIKESNMQSGLKGWIAKYLLHKIRIWDCRTAHGVNEFIAISKFISRRIRKVYGRDSAVIYPPVDTASFSLTTNKEDFYLTASRMVPYKKIDLIVDAFSKMPDKKLIVIGDGPDFEKIKSKCTPNVTLLGFQKFEVLRDHMQKAKAFVFAAEEDFGITPLEAQSCGTPVIAYGKGGALETINGLDNPSPTGVFFYEQSCDAIVNAVEKFEANKHLISAINCNQNASRFSVEIFKNKFKKFVETEYSKWQTCLNGSANPEMQSDISVSNSKT